MFKKIRVHKRHFILTVLLSLFLGEVGRASGASDDVTFKRQWLMEQIKALPSASNIIVLGPPKNGKSTLINMLFHVSEYATRAKEGDVLLDPESQISPLYHRDIFRLDINKPVDPRNFAEASISEDYASIPEIGIFMPVLGPVAAKDFLGKQLLISFNRHGEASSERAIWGTVKPHIYSSRSKVKKPVFQTTLIDAPGIGKSERLTFIKTVIEKSPSEPINAILLVVSARSLASDNFGPETFAYFKELSEIIKQLDPTFTRVLLAITYAGNDRFLELIPEGDDPRRVAANKFKEVTNMVVAANHIFFFENKYSCLSETAVEKLYNCHIGELVDPEIELAYQHREKNYKLNVLESFNLLKTAASINPPLSQYEMLMKIESKLKGPAGKNAWASPIQSPTDKNIIKRSKDFMKVTGNFEEVRTFIIRALSDPEATEEEIEAVDALDAVITIRQYLPSLEKALKVFVDKIPLASKKEDLDIIFAGLMALNVEAKTTFKYVEEEKLPGPEKILLKRFNTLFSDSMSEVIKRFNK